MMTKPQEVSLAIDKNAIAHALGTAKVYSPQDLANLLGVSVQTLHNWRKSRPKLLDDPVKVTFYTFWTQEQVEQLKINLELKSVAKSKNGTGV